MAGNPSKNATGDQIQFILDSLLYRALKPFISQCTIFDSQIVYVLRSITKNKKRKLVAVGRDEAIDRLARSLVTFDKREKFDLIKSIGLERQLIQLFLTKVVEKYHEPVTIMYSNFLCAEGDDRKYWAKKLKPIMRELGFAKRSDMVTALAKTHDYLILYNRYFKQVLGEYFKLCSSLAKAHVDSNPHNQFDYHDVRQGFLQNLIVAVNKYHSSKGALTAYIKWWIFNAQTCSNNEHEYGVAYTVPPSQKRKIATEGSTYVNFSISLDQIVESGEDSLENIHSKVSNDYDLETDIIHSNLAEKVKLLAKYADIDGCARLLMDIDEVYDPNEVAQMKQHMIDQRIV